MYFTVFEDKAITQSVKPSVLKFLALITAIFAAK